jgi:hypothetical protein
MQYFSLGNQFTNFVVYMFEDLMDKLYSVDKNKAKEYPTFEIFSSTP